jgi:hypothetical protein
VRLRSLRCFRKRATQMRNEAVTLLSSRLLTRTRMSLARAARL